MVEGNNVRKVKKQHELEDDVAVPVNTQMVQQPEMVEGNNVRDGKKQHELEDDEAVQVDTQMCQQPEMVEVKKQHELEDDETWKMKDAPTMVEECDDTKAEEVTKETVGATSQVEDPGTTNTTVEDIRRMTFILVFNIHNLYSYMIVSPFWMLNTCHYMRMTFILTFYS